MILAKINCQKIDKAHLFAGEKGTYLDVCLMENRDGPDQYGNDGFVCQGVSKDARDRGERGPIIGNWRNVQGKAQPKQAKPDGYTAGIKKIAETPQHPDDVPF